MTEYVQVYTLHFKQRMKLLPGLREGPSPFKLEGLIVTEQTALEQSNEK